MAGAIAYLRALTSLHPGAGTALGAIDLPIQRETHTEWPMMQSGGVKGVFRDQAREQVKSTTQKSRADADEDAAVTAIFGPTVFKAGEHAGALVVSDARTLLFPVRSLKGVYALVTCQSALQRYVEDCELASLTPPKLPEQWPTLAPDVTALCSDPGRLFFDAGGAQRAVLADIAVQRLETPDAADIFSHLAAVSRCDKERIVIVPDDAFTYFTRFCTEVVTRNALDYEKKTVKRGALFNEEFVPPQTVMYSVLLADRVSSPNGADVDVLAKMTEWVNNRTLQFGGDATTGKGRCAVSIVTSGGGPNA